MNALSILQIDPIKTLLGTKVTLSLMLERETVMRYLMKTKACPDFTDRFVTTLTNLSQPLTSPHNHQGKLLLVLLSAFALP